MTEEQMNQEAKAYRQYREECGYQDPVALYEIEGAYYMGMMKMLNWIAKDAIDGLVVCDKELTHGMKDIAMTIPDNLNVGDHVKLIIVKEDNK